MREIVVHRPWSRDWPAALGVLLFVGFGALLITLVLVDTFSLLMLVVGIALVIGGLAAVRSLGRCALLIEGRQVEIRNRFRTVRLDVDDLAAARMVAFELRSRYYVVLISTNDGRGFQVDATTRYRFSGRAADPVRRDADTIRAAIEGATSFG